MHGAYIYVREKLENVLLKSKHLFQRSFTIIVITVIFVYKNSKRT